MTKNKKRPTYIKEMLNKVNETLRFHKIKNERDTLFAFMCDYLLKKKMYDGFNYYRDEWNPYLGKSIPTLAHYEDFDYLQIN